MWTVDKQSKQLFHNFQNTFKQRRMNKVLVTDMKNKMKADVRVGTTFLCHKNKT